MRMAIGMVPIINREIKSQPFDKEADGMLEVEKISATPKMKLLHENILFVLENRKVYLDKTISLAKLSQMLFTNTTYLSKVVNRFFGCNLKTLLNRYRVEYAKALLKDEDCNMDELPSQCGFVSRSTFYAAFMKFQHMTPTDYRSLVRTQALRANGTGD